MWRYDGLVYKLVPHRQEADTPIFYDTELLLDVFLNKIDLGDGSIAYYDHYCRRTFDVIKYRQIGNLLAADLLEKGRAEEAKTVITKSLSELPIAVAPDISGNLPLVHLAHECGLQAEALEYADLLLQRHLNNLLWYAALNRQQQQLASSTFQQELEKGQVVKMVLDTINNAELNEQLNRVYEQLGLKI